MERSALFIPVRMALRTARLRWARLTCCRAAFLAGKFTSGWILWLLGAGQSHYKPPNALFQRIAYVPMGIFVPATDQKRVTEIGTAIGVRRTQPGLGRDLARASCQTYAWRGSTGGAAVGEWGYTSRFCTLRAWAAIKLLRGATTSPMRVENTSSASTASSMLTSSIWRAAGSIVVSQS